MRQVITGGGGFYPREGHQQVIEGVFMRACVLLGSAYWAKPTQGIQ